MAKSDFRDKNVALLVAFDTEGDIKWVEHADGRKVTEEEAARLVERPLTNINLLKTNMIDILVWEQQDEKEKTVKGKTVKSLCVHNLCRCYR